MIKHLFDYNESSFFAMKFQVDFILNGIHDIFQDVVELLGFLRYPFILLGIRERPPRKEAYEILIFVFVS